MTVTAHPTEPTAEQCSERTRVEDFDGRPAYACWYPQMGGYVGKCVVVPDPDGSNEPEGYGCFEAFVWHNGEFPFAKASVAEPEDGKPIHLHHCSAEQFVGFGNFVERLQKEGPVPLTGGA